jgi:hypothetical protein
MIKYDLVILHTMVGGLAGTDNYFKGDGYGGPESHFGVGYDGTVYQWQDTIYQAEANGAANKRAVSIETADMGTGFPQWNTSDGTAVPPWTPAQLDAIVKLVDWICTTHNIPRTAVTDSLPTRRGIAYHRLGVPGYIVSGGEQWSSSRGKQCPGPKRINQIPGIIARLNREEDIMATAAELRQIVKEEIAAQLTAQVTKLAQRTDVGFARDQILTQLGVAAANAPATLPAAALAKQVPAHAVELAALRDRMDEFLVLMNVLIERAVANIEETQ